jgi:hypothetical protein
VRFTPRTEADARNRAQRRLLKAGWCKGRFCQATERLSHANNDMIEVVVAILDDNGNEHELRDWFTDSPAAAAKFRHACEAIGVIATYERGEITPDDLVGHELEVRIGVRKQRGWPDSNVIEDYRAALAARVVNLRGAG